jgi:O-antigen/teichoic acid export membrane protein
MAEGALKERTAKGLFWGGLSNGLLQVISLVFGVIIGRILNPSDFGVVGVLTIFTALATAMQESGFTSALINRKRVDPDDYNAVFWFNVLLSLAMYLVLFFCAPLIARFFHNPELVPLSRFVFLGFLIGSFGTAQNAWLVKHMQIKEKSIASIVSVVVAGLVSVWMALHGYSYWGIAVQNVVMMTVGTIGLWIASSWRPSFRIRLAPVGEMIGFSFKILITNIFAIINNHFFSVVFGRYYTEQEVGVYNQANKWNGAGYSVVNGMAYNVAQTALVEAADDADRQVRVFRKMMRFVAFVSFPLMFGLSLIAPEFITSLLTDKWLESGNLLRILAIGGAVYPITTVMVMLILSHGGSGVQMWNNIAIGLVQLAVCGLLFRYGVTWMVVAYTAVNCLWLIIWLACVNRYIHYPLGAFLRDLAPYALLSAAVMVATYFLTRSIADIRLLCICRIVIAVVLYAGVMRLSGSVLYKESLDFLFGRFKKGRKNADD